MAVAWTKACAGPLFPEGTPYITLHNRLFSFTGEISDIQSKYHNMPFWYFSSEPGVEKPKDVPTKCWFFVQMGDERMKNTLCMDRRTWRRVEAIRDPQRCRECLARRRRKCIHKDKWCRFIHVYVTAPHQRAQKAPSAIVIPNLSVPVAHQLAPDNADVRARTLTREPEWRRPGDALGPFFTEAELKGYKRMHTDEEVTFATPDPRAAAIAQARIDGLSESDDEGEETDDAAMTADGDVAMGGAAAAAAATADEPMGVGLVSFGAGGRSKGKAPMSGHRRQRSESDDDMVMD